MSQPSTIKRMIGRRLVDVPNPLYTPRTQTQPESQPQPQTQPERSQTVILALLFLVVGVIIAFVGAVASLAALGILGITISLGGTTFAVLSLRE